MEICLGFRSPFEFDMALQEVVFYMTKRGIKVDKKVREQLLEDHRSQWKKLQHDLDFVACKSVNVNSPAQLKSLLYDELGFPKRTTDGKLTTREDAIRALMAYAEDYINNAKKNETKIKWLRALLITKLILRVRAVRKKISSYLEIDLDDDGRARCLLAVGGTETMRFSHSKTPWDTGLNLATVPRDMRVMFVADEGYEMAEFDLNRGESWVYSFLSLDPELMRIHMEGGDFHAETASAIQSAFSPDRLMSAAEISKMEKAGDKFAYKLRYLGKRVNHASAYRMGPVRGAEVVNSEADDTGITVTVAQMRKAQELWRQKYVGIQAWWDAVDKQLQSDRTLRTPYGRVRQFFGPMSSHLLKEATAYVPQSTSVEYLNRGMYRVFTDLVKKGAYGLELLHQNHDSILVQYKEGCRDEVIPEIISRLESKLVINGHEFSIPVEGKYGPNWGTLTAWK